MNTWRMRVMGMEAGPLLTARASFGASPAATASRFAGGDRDRHQSAFATATSSPIFEFGFSDAFLQMWAAFLAQRPPSGIASDASPRSFPPRARLSMLPAQESGATRSVVAVAPRRGPKCPREAA